MKGSAKWEVRSAVRALWIGCSLMMIPQAILAAAADSLEEKLELVPPHGEIPLTFWERHGTGIVIGAVGLLFVVGLLVWLLVRPRPARPVPIEVEVRKKLEELVRQPEDGKTLSKVSQVLRRYLAVAFGLPPEEMTTTEFCASLASSKDVGPTLATDAGTFLRRCDELKFAPLPSLPGPINAAAQALTLVDYGEVRRAELREIQKLQNGSPAKAHA